jgi:hypothetical protein
MMGRMLRRITGSTSPRSFPSGPNLQIRVACRYLKSSGPTNVEMSEEPNHERTRKALPDQGAKS